MPDFIYNGKVYYNAVQLVIQLLGGTYKAPIIWRLQKRTMRFSELKKDIVHVSDKMLASQLKELEENGFISKKVYAEVPPRTEYSLTDLGREAYEVIVVMRNFGLKLQELHDRAATNATE